MKLSFLTVILLAALLASIWCGTEPAEYIHDHGYIKRENIDETMWNLHFLKVQKQNEFNELWSSL